MQYVDIDEITATALSVIADASETDRLYFRQWVYLGLKDIGPTTSDVKTAKIKQKDGFIKKPTNATSIIDIALYDLACRELRYKFQGKGRRIHERRSKNWSNDSFEPLDLSEEGSFFVVGTRGQELVDYAEMTYFSLPLDTSGLPKIPAHYILALVQFIRYMYSQRVNDGRLSVNNEYSRWLQLRVEARGRNKMPTELEAKQIGKEWVTMINKFRINTF